MTLIVHPQFERLVKDVANPHDWAASGWVLLDMPDDEPEDGEGE